MNFLFCACLNYIDCLSLLTTCSVCWNRFRAFTSLRNVTIFLPFPGVFTNIFAFGFDMDTVICLSYLWHLKSMVFRRNYIRNIISVSKMVISRQRSLFTSWYSSCELSISGETFFVRLRNPVKINLPSLNSMNSWTKMMFHHATGKLFPVCVILLLFGEKLALLKRSVTASWTHRLFSNCAERVTGFERRS